VIAAWLASGLARRVLPWLIGAAAIAAVVVAFKLQAARLDAARATVDQLHSEARTLEAANAGLIAYVHRAAIAQTQLARDLARNRKRLHDQTSRIAAIEASTCFDARLPDAAIRLFDPAPDPGQRPTAADPGQPDPAPGH